MALLGVSLILASFVLFCMRRPAWFPSIFGVPSRLPIAPPPQEPLEDDELAERRTDANIAATDERKPGPIPTKELTANHSPAPTVPSVTLHEPTQDALPQSDGQTTPKASAAVPATAVPAFSLSAPSPVSNPPSETSAPAPPPPATLMAPPPRPPTLRPLPPSSTPSSSLAPPPRPRNLPLPARGPGCSTLAPPPTHSSKPTKPSRAVVLTPGHSPLDWARLSGHPTADLRGLPQGTPYLRVTPSMLKRQTGRRGTDAWTVLGGRVYNLSPYLPFHPGGEPELLRGAARDGTRLFGEIHPWVNYEGMLAACLVGIYVTEEEGGTAVAATSGGEAVVGGAVGEDMESMD